MADSTRLFAYLPAPPNAHDALLRGSIAPLVRRLRDESQLESVSFTRGSDPEWLIRLLVRGPGPWLAGRARPLVEAALASHERVAIVDESEFPEYRDEVRRWGGDAGVVLAEAHGHHDTAACLDRLDLESRGAAGRSRREYSLLMTEGLLDLLGLEREARLAFYRLGFAWPLERGIWGDEEVRALEARHRDIGPGLAALLGSRGRERPEVVWGGDEPARSAEGCLRGLAPVAAAWIEARDAGRLEADFNYLVWSIAHLHAIRLGIEPLAEAVLRFLVCRTIEDSVPLGPGAGTRAAGP